jgi:hypothetical protein
LNQSYAETANLASVNLKEAPTPEASARREQNLLFKINENNS